MNAEPTRLYFRQLLSGRDFATEDPIAEQMKNFAYLIGDRVSKECVIVDPAYAVKELLALASNDHMKVVGALATHYHPDHVGGDLFGSKLEGVKELLNLQGMKIHAQRTEQLWIKRQTGISDSDLALHEGGDKIMIGQIPITLLHTPGHTPGSQCFLVENRLVSGDTLFLQGCGRTDFPGGDAAALYRSLTHVLSQVPDSAVLFPGHLYAPEPSANLGETRRMNYVFKPKTEKEWLEAFG